MLLIFIFIFFSFSTFLSVQTVVYLESMKKIKMKRKRKYFFRSLNYVCSVYTRVLFLFVFCVFIFKIKSQNAYKQINTIIYKCTSKRELTFSQFELRKRCMKRFPRNFGNRFRLSCVTIFLIGGHLLYQFEIFDGCLGAGCLVPSALLIWLLANLSIRLTNILDNRKHLNY